MFFVKIPIAEPARTITNKIDLKLRITLIKFAIMAVSTTKVKKFF